MLHQEPLQFSVLKIRLGDRGKSGYLRSWGSSSQGVRGLQELASSQSSGGNQVQAKVLTELVGESGGLTAGGEVSEYGSQGVIVNVIVVTRGRRREARVAGEKLAEICVGPGSLPGSLTGLNVPPGERSCCWRSRRPWSRSRESSVLPALSGRLLSPTKHQRR